MSTLELMLVDAGLNELVADRALSLNINYEIRVADGEPQVLFIHADTQDPNFAVLMAEFGNELAIL